MITNEELFAAADIIEDEMQMDDWQTSYTKEQKELLTSFVCKVNKIRESKYAHIHYYNDGTPKR